MLVEEGDVANPTPHPKNIKNGVRALAKREQQDVAQSRTLPIRDSLRGMGTRALGGRARCKGGGAGQKSCSGGRKNQRKKKSTGGREGGT